MAAWRATVGMMSQEADVCPAAGPRVRARGLARLIRLRWPSRGDEAEAHGWASRRWEVVIGCGQVQDLRDDVAVLKPLYRRHPHRPGSAAGSQITGPSALRRAWRRGPVSDDGGQR
jgi:hypothetical protein